MKFATPLWLWALVLLVPAIIARMWWSLEGRTAIGKLVAPGLREQLIRGGSLLGGHLRFGLVCLAFASLVVALARPQWGEITREVYGEGRNVMVAIDTSRSMLAEDLKPDRLTRAKLAAQDLIDALPEDLIGLMAFSGSAFVQVPITADRSALSEALDQLSIYAISRGGTNLSSAIKLAADSFEETGAKQHALILFTDGENLEGEALEDARKAADKGTIIITVGIGSETGTIIPDPESREAGGGFVRDQQGEIVRTKLDAAALEKVARAGNGIFLQLNAGTMNSDIISKALTTLDTSTTEGASETVPIERFVWPLAAGMVALVVALLLRLFNVRRFGPAAGSLGIAMLCALSPRAEAKTSPLSEASAAYDDADYESAMNHFEEALLDAPKSKKRQIQFNMGATAYRHEDHASAINAFGEALLSDDPQLQEDAHYNMGNTLFRSGEKLLPEPPPEAADAAKDQASPKPPEPPIVSLETYDRILQDWRDAEGHYESSLKLNSSNEDAQHNLEFVRKRIEELEKWEDKEKEQQEQEPQEGGEPEPQEGSEDSPSEDSQQGNESQPGEPSEDSGEEPQPGEGADPEEMTGTGGGDQRDGESMSPGDELAMEEPVNPDTGYTKEQARRQLEALNNEQADIQPIRRRTRARYFKDW